MLIRLLFALLILIYAVPGSKAAGPPDVEVVTKAAVGDRPQRCPECDADLRWQPERVIIYLPVVACECGPGCSGHRCPECDCQQRQAVIACVSCRPVSSPTRWRPCWRFRR